MVEQKYKASKLTFSYIKRDRKLGRSPRSPYAGVATGLLKTPRAQLKNSQKWHSIDTCLKHIQNHNFFSTWTQRSRDWIRILQVH